MQGGLGARPWGLCPPVLDVQQRLPCLPRLPLASSGHVLLPDWTPRLWTSGAARLEPVLPKRLPGPRGGGAWATSGWVCSVA